MKKIHVNTILLKIFEFLLFSFFALNTFIFLISIIMFATLKLTKKL